VRAMAYTIDLLWMGLWAVLLIVLFVTVFVFTRSDFGVGVAAIVGFAFYWGYHVYYEAGRRAATPGKRRMGLKVVAESGGPATTGAIMLRNLARVADAMPFGYFTGVICCLFTRRFQRLGDLVAGTVVVYADPAALPKRLLQPPPPAAPQPPPLALTREERGALVRYWERSVLWSPGRQQELAAHAAALTGTGGRPEVQDLHGMASWLRDS
jgi:uncharacterized RDD family membrane protein YckC